VIANLAFTSVQQSRWIEAVSEMHRLLAVTPAHSMASYNLGLAHFHLGQYAASALHCARAAALDSSHADSVYTEAQARLAIGEWGRGFALYERRWEAPSFPMRWPDPPGRRWGGRRRSDASLLLIAEQGFGDTIQFLRYAPLAAGLVKRVALACPAPLRRLASLACGLDAVVDSAETLPAADLHVPLLSLPFLFSTTPETVPAEVPYLHVDPDRRKQIAEQLPRSGGPCVGVCWKGNRIFVDDDRRTPGLAAFRPILSTRGCTFVNLVKAPGEDAVGELPIVDLMPQMRDFADTAHLIAAIDLVITSDTAVAHLAGALARPCWLILSAAADWRWLIGRDTTPWYPTMRLFRQRSLGDWPEVIERVSGALADRVVRGTLQRRAVDLARIPDAGQGD
jgi:hypothetical protein